jgi:hypothetical protein
MGPSRLSQKIIAENWRWVAPLERVGQAKPILREVSEAMASFTDGCRIEMTTQMEVCWMRDHFPKLTHEEIATLIDAPHSLVNCYAKRQ